MCMHVISKLKPASFEQTWTNSPWKYEVYTVPSSTVVALGFVVLGGQGCPLGTPVGPGRHPTFASKGAPSISLGRNGKTYKQKGKALCRGAVFQPKRDDDRFNNTLSSMSPPIRSRHGHFA